MKTKEKGVTLVALVVTIIVLLILAGVTIALVLGQDGIFSKAEIAAENTNESQEIEQVRLGVLEAKTNHLVDKIELKTALENSINKVFPGSIVKQDGENYIITLPNGNQYMVYSNGNVEKLEQIVTPEETVIDTVQIPENFHHVTGNTREEGIVVADENENEYVWIPVTKNEDGTPTDPYQQTEGKLTTTKGDVEIQLQRTSFEIGDNITTDFAEETVEEHTSSGCQNAIAEDITKFKESVAKKGGYFFGRYEAGIEGGTLQEGLPEAVESEETDWTGWSGGTLVIQPNKQVWNYVTQPKASALCKEIDNNYTGLTSDLLNSYAWDTAIVFIQECGAEENSSLYWGQFGNSQNMEQLFLTGTAILTTGKEDKQCNIYDMAGNYYEFETETYVKVKETPCIARGGCAVMQQSSFNLTATRYFNITTNASAYQISFRPILYWNS